MHHIGLVIALSAIGGVSFIGLILYIAYLVSIYKKEPLMVKLLLYYILYGVIACVAYGLLHNILINPIYFNSIVNLDFSNVRFQTFLVVWSWRALFYFFVFSLSFQYILIKLKKNERWRNKILQVIFIHGFLISTAWTTNFESLLIGGYSLDLYHFLHWIGGFISCFLMVLLEYAYMNNIIIQYYNLKENNQQIKNKLILVFIGSSIVLIVSILGLIIGCVGKDSYELIIFKVTLFSVLILTIIIFLTIKIFKEILHNLDQSVCFLKKAAMKDFTSNINIISKDEFGILGDSLKELKENMTSSMNSVHSSSEDVAQSSDVLFDSIIEIKNNIDSFYKIMTNDATHTTSSSNNAVNKTDDMIAQINGISEKIEKQNNEINKVIDSIEGAEKSISSLSKNTNEAAQTSLILYENGKIASDSMQKSLSAIKDIEDGSVKIREIVKLIDDVSTRIKLLALNASIEAAHAGGYGDGFAVVSHEMRKLADNTSGNAALINVLIKDIIDKIQNAYKLMKITKDYFLDILNYINQTKVMNENISLSMNNEVLNLRSIKSISNSLSEISSGVTDHSLEVKNISLIVKGTLDELSKIYENEINKNRESFSQIIDKLDGIKEMTQNNKNISINLNNLVKKYKLE